MPEPMDLDVLFEELFSRDPESIHHETHPSEGLLRAYLKGGSRAGLGFGGSHRWPRQEMTAHLLTCARCRARFEALRETVPQTLPLQTALHRIATSLGERLRPVPRPAIATIAAQFVVIVGLAGLLFYGSLPPAAQPAGTESRASATVESEAGTADALPESASQAIQVLAEDPDPQVRLAAAEQLSRWADPGLVQPLTDLYEREPHPRVRQAIEQALSSIWSNMGTRYPTAIQAVQELRQRHGTQLELFERITQQMDRLFAGFSSFSADAGYPGRLVCTASSDLTLAQLRRLSVELGGMMIVDRSSASGSFQMRLPFSANVGSTLRRLESEMGLRCRE